MHFPFTHSFLLKAQIESESICVHWEWELEFQEEEKRVLSLKKKENRIVRGYEELTSSVNLCEEVFVG